MSAGVRAVGPSKARRLVVAAERQQRGFSLVELMVVVFIVGLISALAIPTMALGRSDRHAYDDAGAITQLFRAARTRAIARGGAVLVSMSAGAGDRGTFTMYEAVSANAGGAAAGVCAIACRLLQDADGLDADGHYSAERPRHRQRQPQRHRRDRRRHSGTPFIYPIARPTRRRRYEWRKLCWTPLGRSFISRPPQPRAIFDGQLATVSPLELSVARTQVTGA